MKTIYFTVTNDLNYDQRMHRICSSLAMNGFKVFLVGRELRNSLSLQQQPYQQKRIKCFFSKGFLFYKEYNLRLFFFLLSQRMDAVCAIDLDTILPVLFVSKIKFVPRVYDAHEYFTEMKEVITRPNVKRFWKAIEKYAVPKYKHGYTVGEGLAKEFKKEYNRDYWVIRNLPILKPVSQKPSEEKFLFYGGAVNEARGFEYLIPAMQQINYKLVVVGDGNFMPQLKELIKKYNVINKVELKGMLPPGELREIAEKAALGIGLAEKEGLNQFLALPNKFLDYIHAGLPQIAMNFPEYIEINNQYKVAVLVNDIAEENIAAVINDTMEDDELLSEMRNNCLKAKEIFNWQQEEKKLIEFYKNLFIE